jgi:N utilization substance protein B
MLSRRHIRIKVLQALYQYTQEESAQMSMSEKKLVNSIGHIYDLYLHELKCLTDILRIAEDQIEQKRNRKLPTEEDLNPNLKFINNRFLEWLDANPSYLKSIQDKKISWGDNRDIFKKIYKEFQETEDFKEYMSSTQNSVDEDKKIIKALYGKHLVHNETIHQLYEEKDLYWSDDLDAAQMMVAKTIKAFGKNVSGSGSLPALLKDSSDMDFARTLFKQRVIESDRFEKLIREKAENWEMERIAMLDILLMKMALTEMINFKEVPVKVSLNEYIELSKEYSTPKSGNFINGILDKLKVELSETGEIKKIGRGLL